MKVKVHYLFSRNELIGSKVIAWGTEHLTDQLVTPSHIATLINDRWVIESTLKTGVRVIPYKRWQEINEQVAKIPCAQEYREYDEIKSIYKGILNKKYDYAGVIYLGIYLCLNKYFGIKMPKENAWHRRSKYFCCEAAEKLTGIGPTSMKAPVQILSEFS